MKQSLPRSTDRTIPDSRTLAIVREARDTGAQLYVTKPPALQAVVLSTVEVRAIYSMGDAVAYMCARWTGSGGPASSPGQGHCVVFLGKTLYSYSASLHPGV